MKKVTLAVLFFAGTSALASANEPRVPCWVVKLAVEAHGGDRSAARKAARARGYSETDIAEAERRCLK